MNSIDNEEDKLMRELKALFEKEGMEEAIMMSKVTGQISLEFSANFKRIAKLSEQLKALQNVEKNRSIDTNNNRLITAVKKVESSEHGAFVNINNDLGYFIKDNEDCDDQIKMAYGYARRYAAAGMYAQGLIDNETYNHVFSVFKGLQVETGHGFSQEFQIEAAKQSIEYMQSYSSEFDDQIIQFTMYLVENGLDSPLSKGETYDFNRVIRVLKQLKNQQT